MGLAAGTHLGRYEIVAPLGAGGMGEVYRGRDTELGRGVALKVLPEGFARDVDRMARFGREARLLASLNHPNIATVYGLEEAAGVRAIAMELVEGRSLAEQLTAVPLPIGDALPVASQVAQALEAAHEKGIIHRDLKPANVMVTSAGRVKVLDFGLAKALEDEPEFALQTSAPTATGVGTRSGVILGTTAYMSPEQMRGQPLDRRTDIWSFGCLLYEMLTGRMAFDGDTVSDTIAHVLEHEPDWTALPANVPPDVRRLLERCLAKDPRQRLHDIADARLLLEPSAASGVVAPKTTSEARRIPGRLWIAASAVVAGALAAAGLVYLGRHRAIPSVAVLPFVNATGSTDLEYLSDGLAEELINSLTQVELLKVIARPTAFSYKGRALAPRDVGRELDVRAVVMGRLTRHGEAMTVQVDLVDTGEGAELWGGKFERPLAEIASLQQEINRQVTSVLRVKVTDAQERRLARPQTENAETFELYLRGRQLLSDDNVVESLDYFRRSVEKDPNFAKGWAGLAYGYAYRAMRDVEPSREAMPKAREAAEKSLALDPDLAEAHTALGIVKLYFDCDLQGAEAEFKKAMDLNPGEDFSRHWYAHYLEKVQRFEEANVELRRVAELDPLSVLYKEDLAGQYYFMRQPEKAVEVISKEKPTDAFMILLSLSYEMLGRHEESLAAIRKVAATDAMPRALVGAVLARQGKRAEAEGILAEIKAQKGYVPAFPLALVNLGLGNRDDTFRYLEKAYDDRSTSLYDFLSTDPQWSVLRDDPRFVDLMRRLRLPLPSGPPVSGRRQGEAAAPSSVVKPAITSSRGAFAFSLRGAMKRKRFPSGATS